MGWKGLINDPTLDDRFEINTGLRLARKLLLEINEMGIPAGTEYLDLISPQYLADLDQLVCAIWRAHYREPGPRANSPPASPARSVSRMPPTAV